jgi:hypothetical protein
MITVPEKGKLPGFPVPGHISNRFLYSVPTPLSGAINIPKLKTVIKLLKSGAVTKKRLSLFPE